MSKDLDIAIKTARRAGGIIKNNYGKIKNIQEKNINDFVTDTDGLVEAMIRNDLARTGYSFLGEETGETITASNKKWIIDPIDGTSNFIRGNPFFALSIALMEDTHKLKLGVVYNPVTDECYWAEDNRGAYLNGKPIKIGEERKMESSTVLVEHGGLEKDKEKYLQCLSRLMPNRGPHVLRQGGTALMICYVAKGGYEAFLSCGDDLYDYAAGLVIAREAGALVTDWNGNPWDNSSSYVLVSSQKVHNPILERISGLQ